jgi:cytochrome c-type biogenesis protein CcmE
MFFICRTNLAMIRTIITAEGNQLTLTLPDNFLGKQIEVIAFIVEDAIQKTKKKVSFTVLDVPKNMKVNYKFNREEANER